MNKRHPPTVEDFMTTAVITMKETEALNGADLEMRLAEIRHIPVVDEKNNLVGVVSDRDLLRTRARPGDEPLRIASVMTRNVRTAKPSMPAHEAAATMLEHRFGCLPVVGDDGQLIGIITETDFVVVAQRALAGHDVTRGRLDARRR
jgi:CBS domain-containing protein